jgi:hypothetical protein
MTGQLVGELGDRREPALAQRRSMVGQPLSGALPSGGRHAVAHGRGSNGSAGPGCRGAELVHQREQAGEVLRWDGLDLVDQSERHRPEVRRVVARRRREHQAGRPADRRDQAAGHDVCRRRLGDGRHHRRAARPGQEVSPRSRRRASWTCCSPPVSGSRWRWWRWRSPTSAFSARSFTGSQAGVITDAEHGKAKIIDVTPGRITQALADGHIAIVAGFQGVSQDTKDITTLGRGGSDTTAVALAAALKADVCEIYTDVDGVFTADPRIAADGPQAGPVSPARRCSSWPPTAPRSCTCAASSTPAGTASPSTCARRSPTRGHLDPRNPYGPGSDRGSPDHRRRRPRPQRGQDHRRRRARRAGQGGRHLHGVADAGINIDMIVQNVSAVATGRTDISFTLPSRATAPGRCRRCRAQADDRVRGAALRRPDRQALARRRGHAHQPGHLGEALPGARRRRHQHRDDLDLRDPHLGGHRADQLDAASARPTPPSSSTPTRARPSSTEGRADERWYAGQSRCRRRDRPGRRCRAADPRRA